MILTLFMLFAFQVFAISPLESFENRLNTQFQEKISSIPLRIDELSSKNKNTHYQLQRFDLDLSIGVGFGVLVFSKELEKGIELVWERKELEGLNDEYIEEIALGASADETAQQMLPHVINMLSELKASNKFRNQAIKNIYRDARKLTKYVRALQTFNGKESWYVGNYFKNYYFSASGKILGNGVQYDKRLRFRFRTPTPIILPTISKSYEKRVHRKLTRLARHFLAVEALDGPEHRFTMNRVRSVEGLEGNIDFGFGEVSAGRGILLEWFPSPKSKKMFYLMPLFSPGYLRRLTNSIEFNIPDTKNFRLSQIRIKGSIESELSFLFLSLSKFREIEYHYRIKQ